MTRAEGKRRRLRPTIVELSAKFSELSERSLGTRISPQTDSRPRIRGMTYSLGSLQQPQQPQYSMGALLDLAQIGAGVAEAKGMNAEANGYREIIQQASNTISEQELASRYADYHDALAAIATGSVMLADASKRIDSEFTQLQGNSDLEASTRSIFESVSQTIRDAFGRILDVFRDSYHGLEEFSKRMKDLAEGVAQRSKKGILSALHRVFESLSMLFARLLTLLFGWLATIRTIAARRNFKLKKVTLELPSAGVQTVAIFGFSIPYPAISTPKIVLEFS